MNRHHHDQSYNENEPLADDFIDVGDTSEYYRNSDMSTSSISLTPASSGVRVSSSFGNRVQPMSQQQSQVQQASTPQTRPGATYYVQRLHASTYNKWTAPRVDPAPTHSANANLSSLEVKSTLLRPASTYARPTYGHQRNSGLPNSILASSLNANKTKQKKGQGNRKHCNCTKSQCLKLYCECFANGEFCLDCNCKDCHNNLTHEMERSRAIKSSLDRNPNAFKPKIGVASKVGKTATDLERLHQKGCHCKKSNCLKNYCECYEAKVPCTDRCKCQSCRNTEEDRSVRFKEKFTAAGLAQLTAAAANEARATSVNSDEEAENFNEEPDPKSQPWFYMTDDVIEAATKCMVSYAHEVEAKIEDVDSDGSEELERGLLAEFSRCIGQIVESAKSISTQQRRR
ncbi:CRC domain-containing protein [Aphelenchoides besseyi]|nr:CRC domain-containing protein [Aphelenchoides besseyi]